jgi:hypothetical protein
MPSASRRLLPFVIGVAATIAFVLIAHKLLVEDHDWGDDFGLYLQLTENIRLGNSYNYLNTGMLVPPGFPVILVGWETLFGTSYVALKSLNVLMWAIAAWIAYAFTTRTLGRIAAFIVLLALFLLPTYYMQQQTVNSDPPFIVLFNALLFLTLIYFRDLKQGRWHMPIFLAIPFVLYAALLIRPAGLPLVAAIILVAAIEAFLGRRYKLVVVGAAYIAVVAMVVLGIYLAWYGASVGMNMAAAASNIGTTYGNRLASILRLLATRSNEELLNFEVMLMWYQVTMPAALVLVAGVIIGGAAYIALTDDLVAPIFGAAYLGLILVTPSQAGFRYLLPLAPLVFLFYLTPVVLLVKVMRHSSGARRYALGLTLSLTVSFLVFVAVGMADGLRKVSEYKIEETNDPRTQAMLAWLSEHTAPGDMLCTFKPRAFMYFVKRRNCYVPSDLKTDMGAYLRSQGATFAVLTLRPIYSFGPLIERIRNSTSFTEAFRNEDYVVYQLR